MNRIHRRIASLRVRATRAARWRRAMFEGPYLGAEDRSHKSGSRRSRYASHLPAESLHSVTAPTIWESIKPEGGPNAAPGLFSESCPSAVGIPNLDLRTFTYFIIQYFSQLCNSENAEASVRSRDKGSHVASVDVQGPISPDWRPKKKICQFQLFIFSLSPRRTFQINYRTPFF